MISFLATPPRNVVKDEEEETTNNNTQVIVIVLALLAFLILITLIVFYVMYVRRRKFKKQGNSHSIIQFFFFFSIKLISFCYAKFKILLTVRDPYFYPLLLFLGISVPQPISVGYTCCLSKIICVWLFDISANPLVPAISSEGLDMAIKPHPKIRLIKMSGGWQI